MPPIDLRPFRRADRDQVAALVNAHLETVLPGVGVSVNAVLSQLEREPEEYVVDPWVAGRSTRVAVARDRIVAAAHLVRYGGHSRVGPDYRDAAEIRWLVFWPGDEEAADALVAACTEELGGAARLYAGGALPAPAVYGVPESWPHVGAALRRAGFTPGERTEIVLLARVEDLPEPSPPPVEGLALDRSLGRHAPRFTATLDGRPVGWIEVQADLTAGGTLSRLAGWAEVWDLHVAEDQQRRGIATWLAGHAADWLRLARAERLLDYAIAGEADAHLAWARRLGFRELTRSQRAWERGG